MKKIPKVSSSMNYKSSDSSTPNDLRPKRASIKALGCRLNQYEALTIESKLKSRGYKMVPFGDKAELGIINTCTVTNEADSKSRSVIRNSFEKIQTQLRSFWVVIPRFQQTKSRQLMVWIM